MNAVKAVTQFLEAGIEVSGDTLHERIAMDRMPPDFENATAAVMVREQTAGAGAAQAPILARQMAIHCYGGTNDFDGSEAVAARVYAVLHNQSGGTAAGGIVFSQLVTSTRYFEPNTGWAVVLSVYQVETI